MPISQATDAVIQAVLRDPMLQTALGTSIGAGIGSIGAGLLLEVFSARVLFNAQTTTLGVAGVVGYLLVLRPVRAGTPAATP